MPTDTIHNSMQDETLSDRMYRLLRENLRTGAYLPGDKITHRTIAHQHQVSVTPVREAITRLLSEGSLVMTGPKTINAPKVNRKEFEELTGIRLRLEGWAAELAAVNCNARFLVELEELHGRYLKKRATGDMKALLMANASFHFAIYSHANAPNLLRIIDGLWVSIGPTLRLLSKGTPNEQGGLRFHEAAIEALRGGNPQKARKAIEGDISAGKRRIMETLE